MFSNLLEREDVESIFVHIAEIEPDAKSWPYADRVYIFGNIPFEDIVHATKKILPSEIGDRSDIFSPISARIRSLEKSPLTVLWWD